MKVLQFSGQGVIDKSVSHVKPKRYVKKLQAAIDRLQPRFEEELPPEAKVTFHNTTKNIFTFGGWLPENSLSKADHVSLIYNHGPVSSDSYGTETRIDLTPRKNRTGFLGLFKEPFGKYVQRALAEAKTKIDDARFRRNYFDDHRVEFFAQKFNRVLKKAGLTTVEYGVIQNPGNGFTRDPVAMLFMAPESEMDKVQSLLMREGCLKDSDPTAVLQKNILSLKFDNLRVKVIPNEEMNRTVVRTQPNVYRTPLLYSIREPERSFENV